MIIREILSICDLSNSGSLVPYVKPSDLRAALALCALSLFGTLLLQAPAAAHLGGDADSAMKGKENAGTALGHGANTLVTRLLGGQTRTYHARSALFRPQ